MYAWCVTCKAIRLFFYQFTEAQYCCSVCQHVEKHPSQ
jgi:hypothetical protein